MGIEDSAQLLETLEEYSKSRTYSLLSIAKALKQKDVDIMMFF